MINICWLHKFATLILLLPSISTPKYPENAITSLEYGAILSRAMKLKSSHSPWPSSARKPRDQDNPKRKSIKLPVIKHEINKALQAYRLEPLAGVSLKLATTRTTATFDGAFHRHCWALSTISSLDRYTVSAQARISVRQWNLRVVATRCSASYPGMQGR